MGDLGPDPDFPSTLAYSVSGNGQVICGTAYSEFFTNLGAFVWTSGQGIRRLPTLWTSPSEARVVSDDGTTVWGYSTDNSGTPRIVRWNVSTLAVTAIPALSGSVVSGTGIFDTSANGQFAVGYEATARRTNAVRVTPTGTAYLPKPNGWTSLVATGTYPDGSVVVGYGSPNLDSAGAFVWTTSAGTRVLPPLKASSTANYAIDISENGTIVGQDGLDFDGTQPENETAMLWIAERPFTLKSYLRSEYGIQLSNWSALQTITGISRNGRCLTGFGILDGRLRAFRVTFLGNLPPVANAGADIRKNDAAPSGVNVRLNGRKSLDPDGTPVTFRWSGIKFNDRTVARPTAKFPVGTTKVTLTVTDSVFVSNTDTVRVIVKAKRSSIRPQGLAANEAFADALSLTVSANAPGETNESAIIAAENAAFADALGATLGDAYVWGEDESPEGAAAEYGAHRLLQSAYGQAAAASLARAYVETGDPAYAEAYRAATFGTQRALADLGEA